jgi:FMN-binding domain
MRGALHVAWGRRRARGSVLAAMVAVGLLAPPACAVVFHAKDEALALAFPGSDRVEERTVILTDEQKQTIEKRARAPVESQLWTVYIGWHGDEILGYAVIDTHVVRTLPETVMVVLTPAGEVRRAEVLAFYEPPEYAPTERWTKQFDGRHLDDDLKLGAGIQGITGATLSATAMTAGVRRALALYGVLHEAGLLQGK